MRTMNNVSKHSQKNICSVSDRVNHCSQRCYTLVAIGIAITLTIVSQIRNISWQNNLILWGNVSLQSPGKERMHINLGKAYLDNNRPKDAAEHFEAALRINPDAVDSRTNLGIAYKLLGLTDKALLQYNLAMQLAPDSSKLHNNLGLLYASTGMTDKAIEHFKRAILLQADFTDAYFNLGLVYIEMKDTDRARKEFETVLRLNPNDHQAEELLSGEYLFKSDSPQKP